MTLKNFFEYIVLKQTEIVNHETQTCVRKVYQGERLYVEKIGLRQGNIFGQVCKVVNSDDGCEPAFTYSLIKEGWVLMNDGENLLVTLVVNTFSCSTQTHDTVPNKSFEFM